MMTLDELIDWLEKTVMPISFEAVKKETIHYLREYREMKQHLACMDSGEIRGDATQIVNNPPLTWDELKQMEGKPVWVEEPYNGEWHGNWAVICSVGEYEYDDDPYMSMTDDSFYLKSGCGTRWQAYRKERE